MVFVVFVMYVCMKGFGVYDWWRSVWCGGLWNRFGVMKRLCVVG